MSMKMIIFFVGKKEVLKAYSTNPNQYKALKN